MQRVHCQALQDSLPGSPPPLPPPDEACRLLHTWSFKSMISSHGNVLRCIDSTFERNFFKPQAGKCTAAAAIVRLQLWKWQKFLARRKRPHHWSGVAPSSVGVFFFDCLYCSHFLFEIEIWTIHRAYCDLDLGQVDCSVLFGGLQVPKEQMKGSKLQKLHDNHFVIHDVIWATVTWLVTSQQSHVRTLSRASRHIWDAACDSSRMAVLLQLVRGGHAYWHRGWTA